MWQGDRCAHGNGIAIDLCDGQWVAIWIGIVGARIEAKGGVFGAGDGVVLSYRCIVDAIDHQTHISLYGRSAIGDGVGEVHRAVETWFWVDSDRAVAIHCDLSNGSAQAIR